MTTSVVWRHYTGTADSDGLVDVGAPGPEAGQVILSVGGYATEDSGYDSSTATVFPAGALPVPIAGHYTQVSGGLTYFNVLFQATPGAVLRTHVYAVVSS